jgi:D-alanyl-D-alanine carboxypeptidase/D-alanyl-D-alanine-endopeptidase (penicillin-binding protein 4)
VRLVALALLLAAGGTMLLTRRTDKAVAAGPVAPPLATPVFSPRRAPTLFTAEAAKARVQRDLAAAVAPYDACVAVDDPSGPLVRIGTDRALAPASTLKLATAVAALDVLGPDHRFVTRAVVDDAGRLVVVGGGDPLLATPAYEAQLRASPRTAGAPATSLDRLAADIAATGTRRFTGIVVDDSRHDTMRFLPAWKPSYADDGEIGALGALTVDAGFADPVQRTPAPDPAVLGGTRLAELLEARGVEIAGGVQRGAVPAGATELARAESAPLSDVVVEMLSASDNYTAEQVLRELAVDAANGAPATSVLGIGTAAESLTRLGVPLDGTIAHDGSGLSPDDRMRCGTLLALVALAGRPQFAAVDKGLAVAGRSGTLALRFRGDPLEAKLRGKTGSIAGVVGLAGVVDDSEHLRFAFVANGDFSEVAGMELQAAVAHVVADYPQPVDASTLVPPP